MRRVTRDATIGLHRGMFVNKRTLFVGVTLDAGRIGACREARLLEFKSAMWIVAVTAFHRAFEHFVMEGQIELVLGFAVTAQAKLWLALPQHPYIRKARLLRVGC